MTRKQRRLALIGASFAILAVATGLVLMALEGTVTFFYGPSDVAERAIAPGERVRLGGLVAEGSVARGEDGWMRFAVTDGVASVPVRYHGLLPDLFREGQGVVTQGTFREDGVFIASQVLARHDENYMPREVAEALERAGQWKGPALNGAPDSTSSNAPYTDDMP
jgi:cytochrome c-type biogenesis protein CcmE